MYRFLFILFSLFGFSSSIFWSSLPFTDVPTSALYYDAVTKLYDGGIITNNGDNLFRPDDLMSRDFYVSLTVWVGCKRCQTPSSADIIRYQVSPFVDLSKTNPYYYCIAYAENEKITEWYILDTNGVAKCSNWQSYTTPPFCAGNTISRIEAVAILLRRANLWNETLNNSNFIRDTSIPGISEYWYGYAKKWIESWLVTKKPDGTIWQDEKITRAEFATMAVKILNYTQCQLDSTRENTVEWAIGIRDQASNTTTKSTFAKNESFTLFPIVSPGDWNYSWNAINPITWEHIWWSGTEFPGGTLGEWTWIVRLEILDTSGKIVSQPEITIQIWNGTNIYNGDIWIRDKNGTLRSDNTFTIEDGITLTHIQNSEQGTSEWIIVEKTTGRTITGSTNDIDGSLLWKGEWDIHLLTRDKKTGLIVDTDDRTLFIRESMANQSSWNISNLSVAIEVNPLVSLLDAPLNFTSIVSWGSPGNIYSWNFWDGNTTSSKDGKHTYTSPGIYTVSLTVTDPVSGTTRQSVVIIKVIWEKDSDGDGIFDSLDTCPLVIGPKENNGCPTILTANYYEKLWDALNGSNKDTDGDGLFDWSGDGYSDRDSDGVVDLYDACPLIPWLPTNHGCPLWTGNDIDGDWVLDNNDKCKTIPGPVSNKWCPLTISENQFDACPTIAWPVSNKWCPLSNSEADTDGDGILNISDACPTIAWPASNKWCPLVSFFNGIHANACLEKKLIEKWMVLGAPICDTCPCKSTVKILSSMRSCDVIFPTILSKEKTQVYSRGGFYVIP